MDARSDAELVALARSGDREAFGELIRRYQRPICGLARLILRDPIEAEDIAQESFLRAWLNLDLLSDPAKFAPWLRRIAFGASIDWLRAFRPELYRLSDSQTEIELFAAPAPTESALAALEAVELGQRVWDAVSRLPERYRLPLTLFHLDGLSHAKVAQAIGVTESTVRSQVTRARQKLQPLLASYAADIFEEQVTSNPLHITDGESVAGTLRDAGLSGDGLPGDVAVFGDLMYEGPVTEGLEARALFLASGGWTLAEARDYLQSFERTLAAVSDHTETILWLDHRLSNQLILIRLLDWFHRQHPRGELSLICVGRYPGADRFVGLGQLTANQLTSLADTRQRVSEAQFRLAAAAWGAFKSPDPTAIKRVLTEDTSVLPFLAAALRRHLEEFPAVENGLSRTQRRALTALRNQGPLRAQRLFFASQQMENPLYMGDGSFFRILRELAEAKHPLIQGDPIELTQAGLRVLEERDDHVRLNGIDCWLGGVHLVGPDSQWRWDRAQLRLRRFGSATERE